MQMVQQVVVGGIPGAQRLSLAPREPTQLELPLGHDEHPLGPGHHCCLVSGVGPLSQAPVAALITARAPITAVSVRSTRLPIPTSW